MLAGEGVQGRAAPICGRPGVAQESADSERRVFIPYRAGDGRAGEPEYRADRSFDGAAPNRSTATGGGAVDNLDVGCFALSGSLWHTPATFLFLADTRHELADSQVCHEDNGATLAVVSLLSEDAEQGRVRPATRREER